MSMTKLPLNNLLLSSCIAIALNGCASKIDLTPVVEIPAVKVTGHQVSKCKATQRDLTTPWSLRQYWCGDTDRQGDLQNVNDDVMNGKIINNLSLNEAYLDDINEEATSTKYDEPVIDANSPASLEAPVLSREAILKRLKGEDHSDNLKVAPDPKTKSIKAEASIALSIIPKTNINSGTGDSIVFARNVRVLRPQGRAATHAMMDKVSGSGQVLLRGLISPDEVLVDSKLYREEVSVGRALAVKKYWQDQGLDISHIKILHHSPDLMGRAVEAVFRG